MEGEEGECVSGRRKKRKKMVGGWRERRVLGPYNSSVSPLLLLLV